MLKEELLFRDSNTEIRLFGPDGTPKPLWNPNRLGRILACVLGTHVRIPFLTGNQSLVLSNHNLITNVGHAAAAGRLSGQGTYSTFTNIAIGTGATAPAV